MTRGITQFKADWEATPDKSNLLGQIGTSHKAYLDAQAQFEANSTVWGEYRSDKDLASLETQIKSARQDVLFTMQEKGPKYAQSATILKQLEAERQKAVNARKEVEERHISQAEIAKEEAILREAQERYQIQLSGFLFARNKEQFLEKKSADAFSTSKEARQIEGVVRALHGQHLHMGTGEGKSTVVLPITALVDAATNDDGRVVVGSANGLLIDELKENTTKIATIMDELPFYKDSLTLSGLHEGEGDDGEQNGNIVLDMNRDYLTLGELSAETKAKMKTKHWEDYVKGTEDPFKRIAPNGEGTYLEKGNGTIKIFFADEKQLVFDWMKNQKLFETQCPNTFMDEAHVAYDKKTPYALTNESVALSNTDVRDGVVDWVTRYMVAQKLKPTDVIPSGGQDELKSDALREKLQALDFGSITLAGIDEESTQFRNAVGIIAKSLGIAPEGQQVLQEQVLKDMQTLTPPMGENKLPYGLQQSKKELRELDKRIKQAEINVRLTTPQGGDLHEKYQTILKDLQEEKDIAIRANLDSAEPEVEDAHQLYMSDIVNDLAQFIRLKDKSFVDREEGVVIRDTYVDELMEEHKYEPRIQATVLALVGKFEPIKRKVAFKTDTYPSFIHAMRDNIVGFSGTLMYPEPQKAQMKKGSFATFLERETGREVKMLAVPEIKPFPQPKLHMTTDETYVKLAQDLQEEVRTDMRIYNQLRPTLVVDFNGVTSGMRTYEEMKKIYGEKRVRLLASKPTEREAALKYQHDLDEYRKQLANGDIDVLVSTGSAALGVNFEKEDGTFPDLRTVSLGLPDSEERIAQTIGRRRMKENTTRNHLWYLSMEALDTSVSLLQSEDNIHKFDLKKTQEEMHDALNKAVTSGDQKKAAKLVFDLMGETRGSRASDEEFQEGYDNLINNEVIPYAGEYMKKRIAKELLKYDDSTIELLFDKEYMIGKKEKKPTQEQRVQYTLLDVYFQSVGLPSTLYNDIMSQQLLSQAQNPDAFPTHFIHEQTPMQLQKLRSYIFNSTGDPSKGYQLDQTLSDWFEQAKGSVDEYATIVDLAGITPQILSPSGMSHRFVTAAKVDKSVAEEMPGLRPGGTVRVLRDTPTDIFGLVSSEGDPNYSYPVIINKTSGEAAILRIADRFGSVLQVRNGVGDFQVFVMPFPLGRPTPFNGEIVNMPHSLYMYCQEEGKE
ncbi:MAG: hypothetical protein NTV98_05790 [Candidatus Roizmanbacteria bacterium]|nr:hypothetical protein [Candidatus Roizmanbacteria bacterium]